MFGMQTIDIVVILLYFAWIMVNIFPNFFALPALFFPAKWYRRPRILAMSIFYGDRHGGKRMAAVYPVSQAVERETLEQRDFTSLSAEERETLKELRLLKPGGDLSYFSKFRIVL